MRRSMAARCAATALACLLAACVGAPPAPPAPTTLRLLGIVSIAHRQAFAGTVVGGLSGIDYDAVGGGWILVSDDRGDHGPARFYTARLDIDAGGFHAVQFDGMHYFRQADGTPYPSAAALVDRRGDVADIEAIRFDPLGGSIWYASEGDPAHGFDSFVRRAGAQGDYRASLPMPPMLTMQADHSAGPRGNRSFEGLAFAADRRSWWLAMEAPLYQDGPVPDARNGAFSRLTRFDRGGDMLAQYAYPLDPIQGEAAAGRLADNGVAEILAIDASRLLVLERSGVQDGAGRFHFHVRLYVADLDQASDTRTIAAFQGARFRPLDKRLLLDLDRLDLPWIDNVEGMTWGPVLPNGHRTLVLVTDDNFSPDQQTQVLAFEVM